MDCSTSDSETDAAESEERQTLPMIAADKGGFSELPGRRQTLARSPLVSRADLKQEDDF